MARALMMCRWAGEQGFCTGSHREGVGVAKLRLTFLERLVHSSLQGWAVVNGCTPRAHSVGLSRSHPIGWLHTCRPPTPAVLAASLKT